MVYGHTPNAFDVLFTTLYLTYRDGIPAVPGTIPRVRVVPTHSYCCLQAREHLRRTRIVAGSDSYSPRFSYARHTNSPQFASSPQFVFRAQRWYHTGYPWYLYQACTSTKYQVPWYEASGIPWYVFGALHHYVPLVVLISYAVTDGVTGYEHSSLPLQ